MSDPVYIRSIEIPAIVILLANILGAFHLLPVFVQLLLNSSAVVYMGCIASAQIKKKDE